MLFFKRWKIHSKSDLIFSRSFLFLHLSFFSRRKLPIERLFSMAKVFLLRSLCVWISSENCFSIFQRLCLPSNCQFKIGKINFLVLNCICFQSIEHETIANTQSQRVCVCMFACVSGFVWPKVQFIKLFICSKKFAQRILLQRTKTVSVIKLTGVGMSYSGVFSRCI